MGTSGTLTPIPRSPTTSTGCTAPCKGTGNRRGGRSPERGWGWEGVLGADGLQGQGPGHFGCLASPRRRKPGLPGPPSSRGVWNDVLGSSTQGRAGQLCSLVRGDACSLAVPRNPSSSCGLSQQQRFSSIKPQSQPLSSHLPSTHPAPPLRGATAPGSGAQRSSRDPHPPPALPDLSLAT